jgi:hypothetical protein
MLLNSYLESAVWNNGASSRGGRRKLIKKEINIICCCRVYPPLSLSLSLSLGGAAASPYLFTFCHLGPRLLLQIISIPFMQVEIYSLFYLAAAPKKLLTRANYTARRWIY